MAKHEEIQEIQIKDIKVLENHRTNISNTHIDELMLSIKQHGLKQPIGVAVVRNNKFSLIFGQRRLMACEKLGWKTIPAIVTKILNKTDHIILNITENIQRKDPSFVELGRSIDKLESMGLTKSEIAARLGIQESKVQQIVNIYKALPEKHRSKVEFSGKGGHQRNGSMPPQVATKIVRIKRDFGLSDKACDDLVKHITDQEMSKEDMENLAILLNAGLELKDAIEKLYEYHVYHIDIVANRHEVGKMLSDHSIATNKVLFRKIIYGEMKGIKRPDFIKA